MSASGPAGPQAASGPPRDPGLQPERTALAWQRSALSLAGASAIVARLTFDTVGWAALFVLATGLGHSAVVFATSQRHYRARTGVEPGRLRPWPAGVHSALLGGQVLLLGTLVITETLIRG